LVAILKIGDVYVDKSIIFLTSSFAGAADIMSMSAVFVDATNMMLTVTFEAADDTILEGEEFFTFSLLSAAMLANHSFRVYVEDDRM
jgi:hypothetical protein